VLHVRTADLNDNLDRIEVPALTNHFAKNPATLPEDT